MSAFRKHLPDAITALLGAIFVVFGLNGFLHFIAMQPPEGDAGVFLAGLDASSYLLPLLALTQIAVGLALVLRRFVPLALIVLAPISINIFAFHLFLEPATLPMALFILAANAGLALHHREAYGALFVARASERTPGVAHALG